MPAFRDNAGHDWQLAIDINVAREIRNRCGVNVLDIRGGLPKLAEDPILLVDVLYVACEPQCKTAGISDADFGRRLVGEAIDDAGDALVEALIEFFPEKKRRVLRQMKETSRALQQLMMDTAAKQLPAALEQLRRSNSTAGASSPGSPASSASTPAA